MTYCLSQLCTDVTSLVQTLIDVAIYSISLCVMWFAYCRLGDEVSNIALSVQTTALLAKFSNHCLL